MVAMTDGRIYRLTRVRVRPGREQHRGDVWIVYFHRSLQRRAIAGSPPVVGVWAGVGIKQEPDHLGQAGRPPGVDLVPSRITGVEKRRPAALVVDGHRSSAVKGEHLPDGLAVAEHRR